MHVQFYNFCLGTYGFEILFSFIQFSDTSSKSISDKSFTNNTYIHVMFKKNLKYLPKGENVDIKLTISMAST